MWTERLVQLASLLGFLSMTACFDPAPDRTLVEAETDAAEPALGSSTEVATTGGTGAESTTGSGPMSGSDTVDDETGDVDAGEASGENTSADDTTGNGPAACEGSCSPEIPAGFSGPVLVYAGTDDAPPCPSAAPTLVADGFADLQAPDAACSCSCGDPVALSCAAPTLTENGSSCVQLMLNPDSWELPEESCVGHSSNQEAFTVSVPELQTAGSSCAPMATETVPAASWGQNVRLCEAAVAEGACEGAGPCIGETSEDFERTCIYVEGDAACPGEGWTERQVLYEDYADDRGCSDCSCGAPTGSCGGTVFLTQNGCGPSSVFIDSIDVGTCGDGGTTVATHAQYAPEIVAACADTGGEPAGSATPVGGVTLCCQG